MRSQDFCEVYYKTSRTNQSIKELRAEVLKQAFCQSFGEEFSEDAVKREAFGKPYYDFKEKQKGHRYYNLTHTKDFVAVACASSEVGVDAEYPRRVVEAAVKRSCTEQEYQAIQKADSPQREFLKYWTLKESYVKMTGEGMKIPFSEVYFSIEKKENQYQITSNKQENFWLYEIEDGFLSVCIKHTGKIQEKDFVKIIRL